MILAYCTFVLARASKWLIVLALSCSVGLHWAFLQSVAWTTMLADNLRVSSFTEAAQRTFDGKHPCSLCRAIAKGKQGEKQQQFPNGLKKVEFVYQRSIFFLNSTLDLPGVPALGDSEGRAKAKPPAPPPRLLA